MRLETLTNQGLLGAPRIDLDFRQLPAGLVAFVGPNGSWKTTTLETPLATWFRQLPSREKELVDYVSRADAFIETTWELEGQGLFRARVNLDGPHRKADAVLTRVLPDGTTVFLNDGKLTTYDAAIASVLPPLSLMLASVFAAQNKSGAFSKLDRKARADLFAKLLGLDYLAELATRAKGAAGLVENELGRVTSRREILARDVSDGIEAELSAEGNRLQTALGEQEILRIEIDHELRNYEQRLTLVADLAARYAVAIARQTQLAVEMRTKADEQVRLAEALVKAEADYQRDRRTAVADYARRLAAIDRERADGSLLAKELAAADAALAVTIKDADARLENNRKALADKAAIEAAVETVVTIDKSLASFRALLSTLGTEISDLLTEEHCAIHALHVIESAEKDIATVQRALDVPCGGAGDYARCQFLTNADALRARLPGLEAIVAPKAQVEATRESVRKRIEGLKIETRKVQASILELEASRKIEQQQAERLTNLRQAEDRIALWEKRKQDASADHARARQDAEAREVRRVEHLEERRGEREREHQADLARLEQRHAERRSDLEMQLAAIETALTYVLKGEADQVAQTVGETAAASKDAMEIQALIAVCRRQSDACIADLARLDAERKALAARIEDVRRRREELTDLDTRIAALRADLVDWQLLAKAFGRDGLPVLEIDASGPRVSEFANDLLQVSYGGRFTVELVTQVARTSKSKGGEEFKDAFEIHVYDADRGGAQRDLSDLSGGEQVIVDECVRSAIALVVNQRSPIPLRTLWRDECTGALDVDNGPRYVAMLRRLQEIGGYHQILAIIHNPEWAALCDAQVRFGGAQVAIELPPYGRALEAA